MHTSSYDHEGETFTIHHNGDYSGDVKLDIKNQLRVTEWYQDRMAGEQFYEVEIPFEVLRRLVLDYVRDNAISKLEDSEYEELEGVMLNEDHNRKV